jgi:putative solute:sodium symporter small subunit
MQVFWSGSGFPPAFFRQLKKHYLSSTRNNWSLSMPPIKRLDVNFFRPSTPGMKKEVSVASTILIYWALLSFGLPLLVWVAGLNDPLEMGRSFMTETRFLGFPLHYWLIAQGCTIGYVLLCKLYCVLWDREIVRHRPHRVPPRGGQ